MHEKFKISHRSGGSCAGSQKAELVLKNARIVNVFTQSIEEGILPLKMDTLWGSEIMME